MKIIVVDTAYADFLRMLPPLIGSYDEELAKYMERGFGTFDAYSHYLKALGHEAIDVIANYDPIQRLWAAENGAPDTFSYSNSLNEILAQQVGCFKPDVIFLQDIGAIPTSQLKWWKGSGYIIAAQCSCALNPNLDLSPIDVIFTSLPTHIEMFKAKGIRAEYLPLAFDPRMKPPERIRDLDISFVGGVGAQSHWKQGTEMLEAVAAAFPERFHWYGYGIENLDSNSPLRKCFRGPAWGREMYEVYARSKCVVNRHGEVAQGFSNNLRMYEATGCGAMLFTEASLNSEQLFPKDTIATYTNASELCEKLRYFLEYDTARTFMARLGQLHTESHHTYAQRMPIVSAVLSEVLESRKVQV